MAPNQTWRDSMACPTTSKYSFSSGNYGKHARSNQESRREERRRPVPVAIPDMFKGRDCHNVGGKSIPFTRFNTIAHRRKVLKEDLDTIHESVYYVDLKWEDLIPEDVDVKRVNPRRLMAITFIQ
ncbi:unnamed protein product [Aphanomyces euteiches]|uniref:Uncharacterized protein n=1 Tax=Aphanomyces euteiches TaxID=100861 RepID=A0A6G0X5H4_9STRA|nr:hypothetical protein Ae201684_008349 [Aphanomyces euteiches]KAH9069903.1 hypothetical protein Ae201684P_002278 [Aphanomyces euteiches]KAH9086558.1 hypothetical protein LEN26_019985 [Aphanomyces euteiches]KAH9115661.1 hypothetical protein AeMF1_010338 [Aphanomyces euteiches]KAH9156970.1 hypothetical protein AeRB84_001175 [Aphanomyces euteiches]